MTLTNQIGKWCLPFHLFATKCTKHAKPIKTMACLGAGNAWQKNSRGKVGKKLAFYVVKLGVEPSIQAWNHRYHDQNIFMAFYLFFPVNYWWFTIIWKMRHYKFKALHFFHTICMYGVLIVLLLTFNRSGHFLLLCDEWASADMPQWIFFNSDHRSLIWIFAAFVHSVNCKQLKQVRKWHSQTKELGLVNYSVLSKIFWW